jgi:tryptophan halogenase
MNAGWMWQIPLQERVGAGYVFSSKHISADQAIDEVQKRLGFEIEPMRTLTFEPGCFEKVWIGNVVALGLSSGFVEPLEATSIGQMLEQLRNVIRILRDSQGVVAQPVIDDFNSANLRIWEGIRDFLRMHYDSPRRDTPFWQDVAKTPLPPSYADLKSCWQVRPPSLIDVDGYVKHNWQGIFHINNWTYVGVAMGVMSRGAAHQQLQRFPMGVREKIEDFLQRVRPRM